MEKKRRKRGKKWKKSEKNAEKKEKKGGRAHLDDDGVENGTHQ